MDTIDTIASAPGERLHGATTIFEFRGWASPVKALINAYGAWLSKRASRRVLRDLTDDELCDIGLTRAEAHGEVSRSYFWDAPLYQPGAVSSRRSYRLPNERHHG